jgi:hypothetical protein
MHKLKLFNNVEVLSYLSLFQVWNKRCIFQSRSERLLLSLFDYKEKIGILRFGKKYQFFQWFDKEFETISRWNTICFVENISSSTVQLFLNGTKIFSFPIEENLNILLQDNIQIGYCRGAAYKGQIADINAWSQPFSPSQIEEFAFGIKPGKINIQSNLT